MLYLDGAVQLGTEQILPAIIERLLRLHSFLPYRYVRGQENYEIPATQFARKTSSKCIFLQTSISEAPQIKTQNQILANSSRKT